MIGSPEVTRMKRNSFMIMPLLATISNANLEMCEGKNSVGYLIEQRRSIVPQKKR